MKTQKGITLIALIITIIVMLILVGVTINVALSGGLFDKAKTASEQTQRETDKEQLLSAVIGTLNDDGTVNEAELQAHLPDGFEYVSAKNVYKNTVTEKEYTINLTTGKVTEVSTNAEQNTTGNGQQETDNISVVGTYNSYITNGLQSITLANDFTAIFVVGGNSINTTYEYDEENEQVIITLNNEAIPFDFRIIGNNKILGTLQNIIAGGILTTNGGTGITPFLGTYKSQDESATFTFSDNGVFNDGNNNYGIYCLIDNTIYTKTGGNYNTYEIVGTGNDYSQIDFPQGTLYLQQ